MSQHLGTTKNAAEGPWAQAKADQYGVPGAVHPLDYIFKHSLDLHKELQPVTEYYFDDGHASAARLDRLVRKWHPHREARRLSLLEFASGYGCVSRHLNTMQDAYALTACDIHADAVQFLNAELGVHAIPSRSRPRDLVLPPSDVVFALSFFSHMPDATWGGWLQSLVDGLTVDGVLIFTTLGRAAFEKVGSPAPDPSGYWFSPVSEQEDLPTSEYGCMIVSPRYVMAKLAALQGILLKNFAESYWWNYQDLYILQKTSSALAQPFLSSK